MENVAQTINLLLMEDKSTTSVADHFKNENNVHVHLFDNLDDVWDGLKVCIGRSKDFMHFILFFNLKLVKEDVKQFLVMVKEDPVLRSTPVFILSESEDTDVMDLYKSHLTNYIIKPKDSNDLNRVLDSFKTFWFNLTELP